MNTTSPSCATTSGSAPGGGGGGGSSSGSGGSSSGGGGGGPYGACKFLRRKCVAGCIFAPYFDSEQGAAHFAVVHKVFGASNVSKLLLHIPVHKRLDAIVSICYEAQARLRDPVHGCVAHIFALQQQTFLRSEIVDDQTDQVTTLNKCEAQHRSDGSEPLPEGIVTRTSNLEMRPLWGPPKKGNLKAPMSLLAMAVGQKQKTNVNEIIKKFPEDDFVVMLFHYDGVMDDWKDFEWSIRAIHVSAIHQTKWDFFEHTKMGNRFIKFKLELGMSCHMP